MAEHAAELILEGVPIAAEHYEKVYDPLKNKTKQGVQKIKKMRNGRSYDEESDYEEDYGGPPRRSQTDRPRSPRDSDRRRSRRSDLVEERYAYKGSGRARSMGRDGNGSRGIGRDRSRKGQPSSDDNFPPKLTAVQVVEGTTQIPSPHSPHRGTNVASL